MTPINRHLLLAAFVGLGLVTPLSAADPAETPPATTVPSDSNYLHRHPADNQACEQRVAAMIGRRCDVIFIGDSITQSWASVGKKVWEKYYAGRYALNFGVSGDRTEDVLWRLEHMAVSSFRPKVAVLLIGTNNLQNTPGNIALGTQAVIAKTQQTFPGVKIILVSILPNARATAKMAAVNTITRSYANDRNVFYLDLAADLTPAGDSWKGLGPDRLHPNAEGYELWAAALEPLLLKLL